MCMIVNKQWCEVFVVKQYFVKVMYLLRVLFHAHDEASVNNRISMYVLSVVSGAQDSFVMALLSIGANS